MLEENPDKRLHVLVVWSNQLAGDSRGGWDPSVLDDPRVTEYWDGANATNLWFFRNREKIDFEFLGGASVWDSSLLFGSEAAWDEVPGPLIHFGYTVLRSRKGLQESLDELWSDA